MNLTQLNFYGEINYSGISVVRSGDLSGFSRTAQTESHVLNILNSRALGVLTKCPECAGIQDTWRAYWSRAQSGYSARRRRVRSLP